MPAARPEPIPFWKLVITRLVLWDDGSHRMWRTARYFSGTSETLERLAIAHYRDLRYVVEPEPTWGHKRYLFVGRDADVPGTPEVQISVLALPLPAIHGWFHLN